LKETIMANTQAILNADGLARLSDADLDQVNGGFFIFIGLGVVLGISYCVGDGTRLPQKTTPRPTGRGVVNSNVRNFGRAICVRSNAERFGHHGGARDQANPIYFRLALGSWTGTCGEVLITRVLPSE
jgi:hypothetical protein